MLRWALHPHVEGCHPCCEQVDSIHVSLSRSYLVPSKECKATWLIIIVFFRGFTVTNISTPVHNCDVVEDASAMNQIAHVFNAPLPEWTFQCKEV
jgi:hypothetical protein